MTAEIRDDRFYEVVGVDVKVERLAADFVFTEGPAWHPREGHLTFSDIKGNRMHRWNPKAGGGGEVSVFREPSNMGNGSTYDGEGRLLTCEHATSRVVRAEGGGGEPVVLATHYEGKELNSPNDIVVRGDGGIYFTDPTSGRSAEYGVLREPELDFQGVFRLEPEPGGRLTLLADDFHRPNGLCFSLDDKRLFVNDTMRRHIRAFDLGEGGAVSGGEVWAEVTGELDGVPDGMKMDSAGSLFCTGPGGIHVFAPDAACLGVILVPEPPANFTWGGEDMRSLFITARTSLYHARVNAPGVKLF
jgi:gluconolactonase